MVLDVDADNINPSTRISTSPILLQLGYRVNECPGHGSRPRVHTRARMHFRHEAACVMREQKYSEWFDTGRTEYMATHKLCRRPSTGSSSHRGRQPTPCNRAAVARMRTHSTSSLPAAQALQTATSSAGAEVGSASAGGETGVRPRVRFNTAREATLGRQQEAVTVAEGGGTCRGTVNESRRMGSGAPQQTGRQVAQTRKDTQGLTPVASAVGCECSPPAAAAARQRRRAKARGAQEASRHSHRPGEVGRSGLGM